MAKVYNIKIRLLTEAKEGVIDLVNKLPTLLDVFGYKSKLTYEYIELENPKNDFSFIDNKTYHQLTNHWHDFNDSCGDTNVPVLFLYRDNIYSGYFFESEEDKLNNTISYAFNMPDRLDGYTFTDDMLIDDPTHWMYLNEVLMPVDINNQS